MIVYPKAVLFAVMLFAFLFTSACRTGKLPADDDDGPVRELRSTGGMRAKGMGTAGPGAVLHATEKANENGWAARGANSASAQPEATAQAAAMPQLDADLSFDDCVIMAAQYAPDIVESIIDLELAEIKADSAFWRRAPFISARFRVTANLTKQHKEYSDTSARMDFGIYGFEPVVSYFSHKSAQLLQEIALTTHQKAVEKRGEQIGAALLRLDSLERVSERQAAWVNLVKQLTAFQRTRQAGPVDRLEAASALHEERAAQATLDKSKAKISSLYLSLKLMLGVDLDRSLKVRGSSVEELLRSEKASDLFANAEWSQIWHSSPDARIARISLKLQDYNILMAWARYLPDFTVEIQPANPESDYATYSSKDDIFARMYFTLPLLDWGERSRGVDGARLEKTQVSQKNKLSRLTFAQQWKSQWLDMKMLRADLELARERLSGAHLKEQKAELQYKSGSIPFDALVNARCAVITEEIGVEEALLQLRLKELAVWILSGRFRNHFFEPRANGEIEAL